MSSQFLDKNVDLSVIREGNASSQDSLIDHSEQLVDFANAIVGANAEEIKISRDALVDVIGQFAMIEAAGVASNFQRMVRIADSTGIPLGRFEEMSVDVRDELKLEDFLKQKLT